MIAHVIRQTKGQPGGGMDLPDSFDRKAMHLYCSLLLETLNFVSIDGETRLVGPTTINQCRRKLVAANNHLGIR